MLWARLMLDRVKPGDIQRLNHEAQIEAGRLGNGQVHPEAIARIGFIIALLGRRLPWRSDCLVQALAAQSWLADLGVASEIRVGVEVPQQGGFAAHAWLVSGGQIITGGNVEPYAVMIGEAASPADPE